MFQEAHGFDPRWNCSAAGRTPPPAAFSLDFRADLARRMQEDWMGEIGALRAERPNLDMTLTHVDDRLDTGMRDAIGADAARVLPLVADKDFTFLIEDPATVWNLGPQRYPEIAKRYQPLTGRPEKLAIDINVVDRYQDVYPTKQQTGTELFELVHLAAGAFARVALYFENSILAPDLKLLPAAASSVQRVENVGSKWTVESAAGIGVEWKGSVDVDGKPWPFTDGSTVWLPAGAHTLEAAHERSRKPRILDFNGEILSALSLRGGGLQLAYSSSSRAIAVLERKPSGVELDGAGAAPQLLASGSNWALLLPRGRHSAKIWFEALQAAAPR